MIRITKVFFLGGSALCVLALLSGCAAQPSFGQHEIPEAQARSALAVQHGYVLDVQATTIEVDAPGQSRAVGGVIGATAGAFIARDSGFSGQALAGSLGGFLGDRLATTLSKEKRSASQVVVKLDNGQSLAIVQENQGTPLRVGESIYLVGSYPAVRVVRAGTVN